MIEQKTKQALEEIIAQIDGAVKLTDDDLRSMQATFEILNLSNPDDFISQSLHNVDASDRKLQGRYAYLGIELAQTLERHGRSPGSTYNNFHMLIRRAYASYGQAQDIVKNDDKTIENFAGLKIANEILMQLKDNEFITETEAVLPTPLPQEIGKEYIKRAMDYLEPLAARVNIKSLNLENHRELCLYSCLTGSLNLSLWARDESQSKLFSDINELSVKQGYEGAEEVYHKMNRLQDEKWEFKSTGIGIIKKALTKHRELSALLTPIYKGLIARGHEERKLYG